MVCFFVCLIIYDMVKVVDCGMVIGDICLVEKVGGKFGYWILDWDGSEGGI